MGVQRTDYIMVGVKLSYTEEWADKVEDYTNYSRNSERIKTSGLTAVTDGMNGEYIFIGKVLHTDSIDNGFPVFDCSEIRTKDIKETQKKIFKYFNMENAPVKLYVFTHWH
jgi:hypothetical protein